MVSPQYGTVQKRYEIKEQDYKTIHRNYVHSLQPKPGHTYRNLASNPKLNQSITDKGPNPAKLGPGSPADSASRRKFSEDLRDPERPIKEG